ncbi:YgjP-like metallopeptidase domain-containing protein [Psychrobium sp. nBUS_13]|uniref:YgjP-like metallopeptidase domain-containing protein n=1 Tax=Psychrobium sp. nBUS_13 TaxID=3395319 RepID=UPI003EBD1075
MTLTTQLKYLTGYPPQIRDQVSSLIEQKKLKAYLLARYPECHHLTTDKSLYQYTQQLKSQFIKKSSPLSKVIYDDKIHAVNHALGTHSFVSRVQGNKLKAKNEIRIARMFKQAPIEFLSMIVAHELAHIKEKEHNKAFYKLCQHIEPNYFQLELDCRLYLTQVEFFSEIY